MILFVFRRVLVKERLPRMCGDDPLFASVDESPLMFAPHARG